jgi:hypothetical protein
MKVRIPQQRLPRRPNGNGRNYLSGGLLRLCDGCSTDRAREWHQTHAGNWICDKCWGRRFH